MKGMGPGPNLAPQGGKGAWPGPDPALWGGEGVGPALRGKGVQPDLAATGHTLVGVSEFGRGECFHINGHCTPTANFPNP